MRAPFINKDGLYFNISRKISRGGFFSSIGKFFGMQDIEVGDPSFDRRFIITGNNEEKIIRLLTDDRVKELFQTLADNRIRRLSQTRPGFHLRIEDGKSWFRNDFPEGVSALSFECVDVIRGTAFLKALFELFGLVLERLVRLDSAYADDPKVTLR